MLKGKLSRNTRLATHIFRKHSTNAVPGSAYEGKKDDVCMRACSKEKLAKQIWCVFRRESVSNGVQFVVRFEWEHNEPPINL